MRTRNRNWLTAPGLSLALHLTAQLVGAETLVLRGGTVHTWAGPPTVADILVSDGTIDAVGPDLVIPDDARTIDASGHHVYPGMFDAFTSMGLAEINSVAGTLDTTELGMYNPHLQAASAIHPASEVIPVTRANGITHAVSAPRASRDGIIPGQAAAIHLDGWTVEEMAIDPAIAMVINWPAIQTRRFDFSTFSFKETPYNEAKEKADKARAELEDWMDAARHYDQAGSSARTERNIKLESLATVLGGGKKVLVLAQQKSDIEAAVEFGEEQELDIVIVGARDSWKVKGLLAEKGIPVILGLTQSRPTEEDHPYDRPFRTAGELVEAGVKIAFATGAGGGFGPGGPHGARTLPYESAHAAAYGLSREEALKAVTLYPAEILGLDDRLGSIAAGRIANLIVTDGSPLEMTTAVKHLIINGKEVSTDNRHRELYERYRARP